MSDLAAKPAMPTVSAVKLKAALIGLASYGTFTLADATVKLQSGAYALAQVTLMLEISAAVILLAIAAASGRVKSVIPRQPGFTYLRALLLAIETALGPSFTAMNCRVTVLGVLLSSPSETTYWNEASPE